jgi:hypothetical protein
MLRFRRGLLALSLATFLTPSRAWAQERDVVSKEVAVGKSEATLRLEFSEGKPLDVALRDGSVFIDGEAVGTYQSGDGLDTAWRTLLGGAVALDDGALATMLREWTPPDALRGDERALAGRIDAALRAALVAPARPAAKPEVAAAPGKEDEATMLRALLGQAGRLGLLEEALKGVDSRIQLHVEEDVDVGADETVEGSLVVIQGDARIKGTVRGDVVVVDGTLELADEGRITGDVRLADARIERDGGTVEGHVIEVSKSSVAVDDETRDRIRDEIRSELRDEIRGATRTRSRSMGSLLNPFRNVFHGIGGLIENFVSIFVLGLLGMGVVAFAGDKLDLVAEAARRAPGRSAMVGLAGTFLLIPVWILGAVALAVSIVGIPVMIAWLPLFPLAAVAAGLLGYLAVARNVGEWLADSEYRYTDWIRKSNPVYTIVGGLVGLSAFFIGANVISMVPFLGFVRGLLTFVGVMFCLVAVQIGFGAVLLTRGGRRRESYGADFEAGWEPESDVDLDAAKEPAEAGPDEGDATPPDAPGGSDA